MSDDLIVNRVAYRAPTGNLSRRTPERNRAGAPVSRGRCGCEGSVDLADSSESFSPGDIARLKRGVCLVRITGCLGVVVRSWRRRFPAFPDFPAFPAFPGTRA